MSNNSLLSGLMDKDKQVAVGRAAPLTNPLAKDATTSQEMNSRLREMRRLDKEESKEYEEPAVDTLAGFILDRFRKARQVKQSNGVQCELENALRYYHNTYSCEEIAEIDMGPAPGWYPLVGPLTRRMHAFLRDTLADDKEHPRYDFRATAIPDVPDFMLDRISSRSSRRFYCALKRGRWSHPRKFRRP